eukprot:1772715-Rhodomonas_salina.1
MLDDFSVASVSWVRMCRSCCRFTCRWINDHDDHDDDEEENEDEDDEDDDDDDGTKFGVHGVSLDDVGAHVARAGHAQGQSPRAGSPGAKFAARNRRCCVTAILTSRFLRTGAVQRLSLIHISEPTRPRLI